MDRNFKDAVIISCILWWGILHNHTAQQCIAFSTLTLLSRSLLKIYIFSQKTDIRPWNWYARIPELMTLLAASAPQLRCLLHWTPTHLGVDRELPEQLPPAIGQLTQLTSLILGLGSFDVIPAQIDAILQGLPSLLHLALQCDYNGVNLQCLSTIARSCPELMDLDISGAELDFVPAEIGDLRRLTHLSLRHCDIFDDLPDSLSKLTDLRELDLDNVLCELPEGLTACKQLTSLYVGFDTSTLSTLRCLRSLSIWASDSITEYWTQLTALTHLYLSMRSTPYPEIAGLTSLRRVEISGTDLPELPSGAYICGLTSLCFDQGCPGGLPAALDAALQLRVLTLGDSITELTESNLVLLSQLPVLETLYISKPVSVTQQQWDSNTALLMAKRTDLGRTPLVIHDSPIILKY